MATHTAAVSAQNLRKRGCNCNANRQLHAWSAELFKCRVAPGAKGAARRVLRGCSWRGRAARSLTPGIKPGRGGIFLIDAATLLTAALGRLPLAFPALT